MRSATRRGSWWQRCIECSDDAALAAHAQAMRDYAALPARDVRAGDHDAGIPCQRTPRPVRPQAPSLEIFTAPSSLPAHPNSGF